MSISYQNKKLLSAHPLAVAHLTTGGGSAGFRLVEWTSVVQLQTKKSGPFIRHTLAPILREHVGITGNVIGFLPNGKLLKLSDVGRTLVVDISLDDSEEWVDVHVR
jgi:hypothetical protein